MPEKKDNRRILAKAAGVKKFYELGKVWALDGIDLEIFEGEFVSIMGPSGCGKSTFLHILGGVDRPTSGKISVLGKDLGELTSEELSTFRRENVGIIFQSFNLLQTLSAYENVLVPVMPIPGYDRDYGERATKLLEKFGLADRRNNRPTQLSGGQNQRVAIARALITAPKIILADEPTGNLDSKNGKEIMALLSDLNKEAGTTVVVITHDPSIAALADRVVKLKDGRVVSGRA